MDGVDENAALEDPHEQLMDEVRQGNVRAMESILRQEGGGENVFVNRKDHVGRTPLVEAARFGRRNATEFLLSSGADPNLPDNDGRTALIEAARRGHTDMARVLLMGGADPNAQDVDGGSALIGAASRHEGSEMVRLLWRVAQNPTFRISMVEPPYTMPSPRDKRKRCGCCWREVRTPTSRIRRAQAP